MGKTKRRRHLSLIGVAIFLGYLSFSMADSTDASNRPTTGDAQIRVEDGQGFTRIVFPCDRPEASSVEPDLDRTRFLVNLSASGANITAPPSGADHPLVKSITILPNSEKGVQVQVVLAHGFVDWVSYRYESPPRTVLYLRPRSPSKHSEGRTSGLSVSHGHEVATAKKPKGTSEDQHISSSRTETSTDRVKTPGAEINKSEQEGPKSGLERGRKEVEDLWRPSAADIPEFVHLGTVYPPDFHEMEADQRRLYLQALEKFRNGDFSRAKEISSKIVPKDGLSSLAETLAFFKADCDFRATEADGNKAYTDAIQNYREAMTQFPESRFVPHAVLMMARAYRRMKFFQEATIQYELFLTKFPENPAALEALFWKGECLFQRGKYGEAKTLFGEFAKKNPRSIHGRIAGLRVADCLYKMGDLKGARHQYGIVLSESSALSHYPIDSLSMAGRSFLATGDFQTGREILFKGVNLDPGSSEALRMMDQIARSYLDENREDEALKVNLLLLESLGSDDSRVADMGLRPSKGDYVNLASTYQDFVDPYANLAEEVMYQESLALVQTGQVDQATAMLKQILSKTQQDLLRQKSLSLLAYCLNSRIQHHHGQSDHLEVIRLYNENEDLLLSDENRDKGVLLLVGESFKSLGLLEDALAVYHHAKAAGDIAEDYVLFQIGRVLSMKGDKRAARKTLEDFHRTFPESLYLPQVQKLLGDFSLDVGDHHGAIKWYRLGLEGSRSGPDVARIHMYLGQALKESGRSREATEAYQKAVNTMWPFRDQTWAKKAIAASLAELAAYHDDQGAVSKAIECYEKIVGLSPSEDQVNWALYRLGVSHRKMGNVEEMNKAFEDLNQRSTDSLWTKLATWTAGEVTFEDEAEPYLAGVRQTLMKTKKK